MEPTEHPYHNFDQSNYRNESQQETFLYIRNRFLLPTFVLWFLETIVVITLITSLPYNSIVRIDARDRTIFWLIFIHILNTLADIFLYLNFLIKDYDFNAHFNWNLLGAIYIYAARITRSIVNGMFAIGILTRTFSCC